MRLKNHNRHLRFIPIFLLLTLSVWVSITCAAEAEMKQPAPGADQPIDITADKLIANQNAAFVEFSGNVKAVQGQTTIIADNLKVFYQESSDANAQVGQDRIKQITATGHVNIRMEDKQAQCEEAVYLAPSQTIILSGQNTRLQSQNNTITGEKITIYQKTGQIIVEGGENRVNAVFQPDSAKSAP